MDDMNDSGIDHSPGDAEDYDENVDGDEQMEDEDEDYGGEFRQQKPRGGRGGFRYLCSCNCYLIHFFFFNGIKMKFINVYICVICLLSKAFG